MDNKRPKQILDHTFKHLEKVLEEMKQEKPRKREIMKSSRPEHERKQQDDADLSFN